MKKQSQRAVKALAATIFGVGFVTPLMFSNIAEALNYGAGGVVEYKLYSYSDSTVEVNPSDTTKWANGTSPVDVNFHNIKMRIVSYDSTNHLVTLYSYETDGTKFKDATGANAKGEVKYNRAGYWSAWSGGKANPEEAYSRSNLMTAMDSLYASVFESDPNIVPVSLVYSKTGDNTLYEQKEKTGGRTEQLDSKYIWAPGTFELGTDNSGAASGEWQLTKTQRAIGINTMSRSPYPSNNGDAYLVSFSGNITSAGIINIELLRPALQILNQTSWDFKSAAALAFDKFTDNSGNGTEHTYVVDTTATKPNMNIGTTTPLKLNGAEIYVPVTTEDVAAGTSVAFSVSDNTVTETTLKNMAAAEHIQYLTIAEEETGSTGYYHASVSNLTSKDYRINVFGTKLSGTKYTTTEFGTGVIDGIRYENGNIHMQVSGTVNAGVPVTASNGAVVDFGGGALTAKLDFHKDGKLEMNGQMTFGTNGYVKQEIGSEVEVPVTAIESENNDAQKALFKNVTNENQLNVASGNLTIDGQVMDGKYYVLVEGTAVAAGTVKAADLWMKENIDFDLSKYSTEEYLMAGFDYVTGENSIALKVQATTKEEGNTSGLAAVQQGNITVAKEISDEVVNRLSFVQRPSLLQKMQAKVRDGANTNKDKYTVETVEQGKANEVMPVQLAEKDKYDKEVWASHIRTKETTEGMKLGAGLEGNNTAQYNGAVVGVDFYSSKKAIAGLALGYITGDIDSYSGNTFTRNKSKYYGVSFYDRVTNGNTALIYDIGYIRGDNDISQFYNKETTADVKTDTYTAGVRYEAEFGTEKSRVVPFASFRYMRQNNKDYTNSHNTRFEAKNQNLYIPKVGIAWTGDFAMPQCEWTWRPSVEVGYVWNLGDRSVNNNVFVGASVAGIEYDTADRSSYYAKAGMEFINKNFTAGLFYRYLKGDKVRNNKWNVNVAWSF